MRLAGAHLLFCVLTALRPLAAAPVGKLAPSLYLASAPAAPLYGDLVTIGTLALGAQGAATPTGTVTLSWETGSAVVTLDNNGHGSVNIPSSGFAPLGAGAYTINATYEGDVNCNFGADGAGRRQGGNCREPRPIHGWNKSGREPNGNSVVNELV
jgi:hypothetical protein